MSEPKLTAEEERIVAHLRQQMADLRAEIAATAPKPLRVRLQPTIKFISQDGRK